MATSTYKTFLMVKGTGTSTTYSKVVDITELPNLGGDPELLDATTLSDRMRVFVMGIQNNEGMSFTANYTKADYTTVSGMTGERDYSVWFGGTESTNGTVTPTGSEGKFDFKGEMSVYVNGAGVNAVRTMTMTIAPSTPITFS